MLGDGTEIGAGNAGDGSGDGRTQEGQGGDANAHDGGGAGKTPGEAGWEGKSPAEAGDGRPQAAEEVSRKPQFFVKAGLDFAGAAWLRDGKYGRFISVVIDKDLSKGAKLRISPRREHAGILGAAAAIDG